MYHTHLPRLHTEGSSIFGSALLRSPDPKIDAYETNVCYMRLPQQLIDAPFFSFSNEKEFLSAVSEVIDVDERRLVESLIERNLIPATSMEVLACIFGLNTGIVWSFLRRTDKHYRKFSIQKGKGFRSIVAPRIGLKIIQKWISVQLSKKVSFHDNVFGFVPLRSHIDAASRHLGSKWVYSIDIRDFFSSTPKIFVASALMDIGYPEQVAEIISSISCYRGFLAQGSPSSPVLSNIAMRDVDNKLSALAKTYGVNVTRYADDVTFSGVNDFHADMPKLVREIFSSTPWVLAEDKTRFSQFPSRLKVHGLLVDGEKLRLTKGYRNKLRAYEHVLNNVRCKDEDIPRLKGHLRYASQVMRVK